MHALFHNKNYDDYSKTHKATYITYIKSNEESKQELEILQDTQILIRLDQENKNTISY